MADTDDGGGLVAVLRAELTGPAVTAGDWETRAGDFWHHVEPTAHRYRLQGWKLHLSALPGNADEVLRRTARVLLPLKVPFKFVGTTARLRRSLARDYHRAAGGKFVTVYPDSDAQCVALAEALDRATEGLTGPGILSDRPYREGGLVHYRYGGFAAVRELGDDGLWRDVLVAPDGTLTPDERQAWFAPPPWATDPFRPEPEAEPGPELEAEPQQAPPRAELLLADRYRVTGAVRHSNKGGVYRAQDTRNDDAAVIIKQGRPWLDLEDDGRDVRDLLCNEAAVLAHLAPTGVVPRRVETFEVDDHLFLVQEEVAGTGLRDTVTPADPRKEPLSRREVLELALAIVELVSVVHRAGVVVRDLSPANLIVRPDGSIALIDLEAAVLPGGTAGRLATPGYAAPEQRGSGADPAADRYSVGALIALLCLQQEPLTAPGGDVVAWVRQAARHYPVAAELADAVEGLTRTEPKERWGTARVRSFLKARLAADASVRPAAGRGATDPGRFDDLVEGSLDFLLTGMRPDDTSLWPVNSAAGSIDPRTLQFGAPGITSVLVQARDGAGGRDPDGDRGERLAAGLREAARWYDRGLDSRPGRRVLPGLYAGHAGTCLAAYETALRAGDEVTCRRALAMARRLPVRWATPDVFHGTAGAGIALLRLHGLSGDPELADRSRACAEGILAQAHEDQDGGGLWWPTAGDGPSGPYYGFAHGCAGIGTFLLAAGSAHGEPAYTEAARRTGDLLAGAAVREDGAAWWGEGPRKAGRRLAHWCHGASGVGTFLLRLWQATGHDPYRELAEEAAAAVLRAAPTAPLGACHGISGDGQFLLDLYDALDDPRHRAGAEELADTLAVRAGAADGRPYTAGDCWERPYADHATGVAGALSFLLRLRNGGPRPWLPDTPVSPRTP